MFRGLWALVTAAAVAYAMWVGVNWTGFWQTLLFALSLAALGAVALVAAEVQACRGNVRSVVCPRSDSN